MYELPLERLLSSQHRPAPQTLPWKINMRIAQHGVLALCQAGAKGWIVSRMFAAPEDSQQRHLAEETEEA